jgi:hypothetical protein
MIDIQNEGVQGCRNGSNEMADAELTEMMWTTVGGVQLRDWAMGVGAVVVGIHLGGI